MKLELMKKMTGVRVAINKVKRSGLQLIVLFASITLSRLLVVFTTIESSPLFDTISLFAYFGVLVGFSLTVYTFGLSMITDIQDSIEKSGKYSEQQKAMIFINLKSGFNEIKEDIWIIFFSIIFAVIMAVLKNLNLSFLDQYRITETGNVSLFILSTVGMYDVMKTMFALSEIKIELLNVKEKINTRSPKI